MSNVQETCERGKSLYRDRFYTLRYEDLLEDPARQINIFYHIIEEDLSVRATEELVRRLQSAASKDPARIEKKKKLNTEYEELAHQLSDLFRSEVQFRINEKGRGKIVIPFSDTDDMERIIGLLDKLNR